MRDIAGRNEKFVSSINDGKDAIMVNPSSRREMHIADRTSSRIALIEILDEVYSILALPMGLNLLYKDQ